MKDIVTKIHESANGFSQFMQTLEYKTKKPRLNKEDYIQVMGNDKHFWNTTKPVWVKVDDLGPYIDQEGLLKVCYNLVKSIDPKCTHAEIGAWYREDHAYVTFAVASTIKKDRMWHPEWIMSNKYPFKK